MSWARFDDRYHDNRKVKRAWRQSRASIGLHAMAVTYCAMHETDGVVDGEWIEDKLPATKEREQVINALVECELFEIVNTGYRVHDYLDYNQSREAADAKRAQKAERQQRWRERRASTNSDRDASVDASRDRATDASTPRHVDGGVDAAPTRPDPTHPPLAPQGDQRVTFRRKPVPASRVELAEQAVEAVNRHAGTHYRSWTGDGTPTEDLRRAIGFLTDRPDADATYCDQLAKFVVDHPWWKDGPATVGAVFGPKVADQNVARLEADGTGDESPNDIVAHLNRRSQRMRQLDGRNEDDAA